MHEQNFEDQVRKKMQELDFTPSEPVWQKVEEQIRKRKDKRRFIYWLLPVLLTGSGVYWWLSDMKSGFQHPETQTYVSTSTPYNEQNKIEANVNQPNNTTANVQATGGSLSINSLRENDFKNQENVEVKKDKLLRKQLVRLQSAPSILMHPVGETKKTSEKTDINRIKDKKSVNDFNTQNTDEPSPITVTSMEPEMKNADTLAALTDTIKTVDSIISIAQEELDVVKKVHNKWAMDVHATAGISGITTQSFFGGNTAQNDMQLYNSSLTAVTQAAIRPVQLGPSKVQASRSFSIGMDVKKAIVGRLQLSTGLQYSYFSTVTPIGYKINKATSVNRSSDVVQVNAFYLNNNLVSQSYRNQYHFLQVPVGIDWQLLKKNPLAIKTGFLIGRLLATNALYYDSKTNLYFKDKSAYQRMQYSAYAGLAYKIASLKKSSLSVGPKAQFQLTNLLQKAAYGEQHLFFAGIGAYLSYK